MARTATKKKPPKKAAKKSPKKAVKRSTKAPATAKLDLYKQHKDEYVTPTKPVLVQTKPTRYLTIVGRGEPGGEQFQRKIGALYAVAYTMKFTCKFAGRDYKVCDLEGLWWGPAGEADFSDVPKDQWNWKLMIRTPDFITDGQLVKAIETLQAKGKEAEVGEVRLETIDEGRCVQMLHVGPYDREPQTIAQMVAFVEESGLEIRGRHHEIYLSDPRRVAPDRLRTILRLPVGDH